MWNTMDLHSLLPETQHNSWNVQEQLAIEDGWIGFGSYKAYSQKHNNNIGMFKEPLVIEDGLIAFGYCLVYSQKHITAVGMCKKS